MAQILSPPSSCSNLSDLLTAIETKSKSMEVTEPKEIHQLRNGTLKIGANNQYFATIDFVTGLIRDQAGTWYALFRTLQDDRFTIDQFSAMVDRFDLPYSNFLRFCGFPEISTFVKAIKTHLSKSTTTREAALTVVRAFVGYLNRLTAWSFHYFPWHIGKDFTFETSELPPPATSPDLSRRVRITDGQKVRLTWDPLGVSVVAVFATKENPELCNDVLEKLPCTVVQDHALISGESMYAWAPVVSTSPVRVKERQCDAPVGRVRYSQGTGNKIVVQYGLVSEDIETPVLGEVIEDDRDKLVEVGRAVWKSTFETKEVITITLEVLI